MKTFDGKRILVVEDEPIIGMMAEDMLAELGAVVVGPASTLEQALHYAESHTLDAAILDINLNGKRSVGVAEVLTRRGVPFVYATGYDSPGCGEPGGIDIIEKPFEREQVVTALERAMRAHRDRQPG